MSMEKEFKVDHRAIGRNAQIIRKTEIDHWGRRVNQQIAAEGMRISKSLYAMLEAGSRDWSIDHILKFSMFFKKPYTELLGDQVDKFPTLKALGPAQSMLLEESKSIPQLDVYASAGGGAINTNENVLDNWYIPPTVVNSNIGGNPGSLRIISIRGDSMPVSMPDGSMVFVDVDDKVPSPSGIFILFDGYALVAKNLDVVIGDKGTIRVSSENDSYPPYEVRAEDVNIVGRVKASMNIKRL